MTEHENKKTKVLFVCIGNMCRSPMAEGFARDLGGGFIDAYSAGMHPTGVVSEDAIQIMAERGIDISRQRSNGLRDVPLREMDIVVSMTGIPAKEYLPGSFQGHAIDWDVDDPIGRSLTTFRRVRDEIEEKVKGLLERIWKADFSRKT